MHLAKDVGEHKTQPDRPAIGSVSVVVLEETPELVRELERMFAQFEVCTLTGPDGDVAQASDAAKLAIASVFRHLRSRACA